MDLTKLAERCAAIGNIAEYIQHAPRKTIAESRVINHRASSSEDAEKIASALKALGADVTVEQSVYVRIHIGGSL